MTDQSVVNHPPDALDELVSELLGCGAVLSQIISHMVAFEASGRSDPGLAPIPEVAHGLVRSVLAGVKKRYSKADIRTAAAIVSEVTDAIGEEIFFVP